MMTTTIAAGIILLINTKSDYGKDKPQRYFNNYCLLFIYLRSLLQNYVFIVNTSWQTMVPYL